MGGCRGWGWEVCTFKIPPKECCQHLDGWGDDGGGVILGVIGHCKGWRGVILGAIGYCGGEVCTFKITPKECCQHLNGWGGWWRGGVIPGVIGHMGEGGEGVF